MKYVSHIHPGPRELQGLPVLIQVNMSHFIVRENSHPECCDQLGLTKVIWMIIRCWTTEGSLETTEVKWTTHFWQVPNPNVELSFLLWMKLTLFSLSGNKSQREELDSILFIFEVSCCTFLFWMMMILCLMSSDSSSRRHGSDLSLGLQHSTCLLNSACYWGEGPTQFPWC